MPPQEKNVPGAGTGADTQNKMVPALTTAYANKGFVGDAQNNNAQKDKTKNDKVKDEATLEFDDLLPHLGEFGIYQKLLFLMMIPFAFFVAWVYFTQIFITINPEEHWCWIPELENITVEER